MPLGAIFGTVVNVRWMAAGQACNRKRDAIAGIHAGGENNRDLGIERAPGRTHFLFDLSPHPVSRVASETGGAEQHAFRLGDAPGDKSCLQRLFAGVGFGGLGQRMAELIDELAD
jgi:hypothetical protein